MLGRSNPDLIISAHDHKVSSIQLRNFYLPDWKTHFQAFITSQSSNGQLDVKHIWDYVR